MDREQEEEEEEEDESKEVLYCILKNILVVYGFVVCYCIQQ